eukprot:3858333-Rhodomonas_salina.2
MQRARGRKERSVEQKNETGRKLREKEEERGKKEQRQCLTWVKISRLFMDKCAETVKEILQKAFVKAGTKPLILRSDGAG